MPEPTTLPGLAKAAATSDHQDMRFSVNRSFRKWHRWGAILTAIPLLLVIVSGLLLQVKKQSAWVQPPTAKGSGDQLLFDWNDALQLLQSYPEAKVESWEDVDRIDVRPNKGVAKIRCNSRWELQIDTETGEELAFEYRRSDFIESLHDGSFFSDAAKLYLFLPNGIVLLLLWCTGMYLWWLPIQARRKKKMRKNNKNG